MNKKPIPLLTGLLITLLTVFSLAYADENGNKLLTAARAGDVAQLKQLLHSGVKVDTKDGQGWTSLMVAAEKGHVQAVRSLLMWGAKVNVQNNRGLTPLMLAATEGHDAVVEMLLKAGADPRLKDKRGWTALKWAELSKQKKVTALLTQSAPQSEAAVSQGTPTRRPMSTMQSALAGQHQTATQQATDSQAKTAVVTGVDRPDLCLRIRSGPGTTYNIIGCVELGQILTITGLVSPNQNWAQIVKPVSGWVYTPQIESDYLPKRSVGKATITSGPKTSVTPQADLDKPSLEDCYEACDQEFHMTFGYGVRMEYRLCRSNCRDKHREVYWTR